MGDRLAVQAVGMVSSVGADARSSCAAIRARVTRFEEVPFRDLEGKPVIGAPAQEVAPGHQGKERLARLLVAAVDECVGAVPDGPFAPRGTPAVFLVTDALSRSDRPDDVGEFLLGRIRKTCAVRFSEDSRVLTEGPTCFFRALSDARGLLLSGQADGCLVAAVDSLLSGEALSALDAEYRLLSERNSDGVVPGEAAAAVWVTRKGREPSGMLDILGLGFGEETSVLKEGEPNLSVGLAAALRAALADAGLPLEQVDFRVGGMRGEQSGFTEASTAFARLQRVHRDRFEQWVPAEILGDVGAAMAGCITVTLAVAMKRGYAPGTTAIAHVASNSADRAACVVAAPGVR